MDMFVLSLSVSLQNKVDSRDATSIRVDQSPQSPDTKDNVGLASIRPYQLPTVKKNK